MPKRLRARELLRQKLVWVGRYDRAGRDRMDPDLLAYVHQAADTYREGPDA